MQHCSYPGCPLFRRFFIFVNRKIWERKKCFSNFSCRFLNPNIFFQFELWLFYFLRCETPPETSWKSILLPKIVPTFTVWINCSSDLKTFENSRLKAENFKSFSQSIEQFFLTVGQKNFGNIIPIPYSTVPKDIEKQVEDEYDGDMIIRSVIVRPWNLKSDPGIRKEN